jgi:hypothetical protein
MMLREDRIGQVVEVAAAGFTMVALTLALALMKPTPPDLIRAAADAADALRVSASGGHSGCTSRRR